MNESELIAYDWLIEQGVEASTIVFRSRQTPDFVVDGGRGYEVKRLYGKSIRFTSGQTDKLLEYRNAAVLVTDGDAVVASIKASVFASRPAVVEGFAVSYQEGSSSVKMSSEVKTTVLEIGDLLRMEGTNALPEATRGVFKKGITQSAILEAGLVLMKEHLLKAGRGED